MNRPYKSQQPKDSCKPQSSLACALGDRRVNGTVNKVEATAQPPSVNGHWRNAVERVLGSVSYAVRDWRFLCHPGSEDVGNLQ